MSKNLFVILFFMIIEVVFVFAEITSTHTLDEKNCKFSIQVNEDNKILFAETQKIPGHYGTIGCYETSNTGCLVNTSTEEYKKGTKELSSQTFESLSGQVCYFQAFDILSGSTGCWNGGLYYVYALRYRVSCEDSTSIPTYCAKSEGFAKQVLLTRQELKCAEKGGVFEGGVYPFTQQDGSKIYCVSATCETCESKWRDDYMNHWKDSVCCDERKREPNSNNGACQKAGSMDSTKIGVKNSKITGFPGCSKNEAGLGSNYCQIPQSSSSILTSSSSSIFSSSSYSSSSEDISSSSEEQEKADCYTTDTDANAALFDAEWKCSRLGKKPDYEIDYYNCLVGECIEVSSSSHQEDNNDDSNYSSSEIESSSSGPELCRYDNDVLRKEDPNEDLNTWTYVGKEKYNNREMTSLIKKKSSDFFDVLGRAYKKIVSQIKYYMGKETEIKAKVEVSEELEVWVKKESYDGEDYYIYRKENEDGTFEVDSTVNLDGTYSIWETNYRTGVTRSRRITGVESFHFHDESGIGIKMYFIGLPKNEMYDENGLLMPNLKEVRGDTAFVDLEYKDAIIIPVGDNMVLERYNSKVLQKRNRYCSELNEYTGAPKANCLRYEKEDISTNKNTGKLYSPGKNQHATFGSFNATPLFQFNCECDAIDGHYYHTYNEDELLENISIVVMESNWKYDKKNNQWTELCWSTDDKQKTYEHEVQHYRNAKKAIEYFYNKYLLTKNNTATNNLFTQKECIDAGNDLIKKVIRDYNVWSEYEMNHYYAGYSNKIPPSPIATSQNRVPIPCPN